MFKRNLLEIGVSAHLIDFEYLNYALEIYKPMQSITTLYADIAEHFNATPSRVERGIRNAIHHSNVILQNSEFIAQHSIMWGKNND